MSVAHDVYSETNPAFCAHALVVFIAAFATLDEHGPELPVAYLALPIALSGDMHSSFDGTNKNTGLLEWLERSPHIHLGLTERVNGCLSIVTEAVRFGSFSRVLTLDEDARLRLGERRINRSSLNALSAGPSQSLKYTERLGYWFAAAGSTKTVFDMMGLTT